MKRKIIYILHKTLLMNLVKYIFWLYDCIILKFVPKPKDDVQKKKVMFLCSFGVGDGILFLSTLDKYRKMFPKSEYEITVLCNGKTKMMFEEETDFDHIIEYDIDKNISRFKGRLELYKIINKESYEYFIDALGPNQFAMNVYTTHASFAKNKVALVDYNDTSCPKRIIKKTYNMIIEPNKRNQHTVENMNQLIDSLLNKKSNIIFYKTKTYQLDFELPKKYSMVFPSSNSIDKNWPSDRYAKLIDKIYKQVKIPVVFSGTKKDQNIINEVISKLDKQTKYVKLDNKTTVMQFVELIKRSEFIVTNDSGPYHIAISENIPVAGIIGGYTYSKYAHYNFEFPKGYKKPYLIVKYNKCFNCKDNCRRIKCNEIIWPCLNDITFDQAWKTVEKMIEENYKNKGDKNERKNK